MFTGDLKEVELLVNNDLVGVMLDRFGKAISIIPVDSKHFKTRVTVAFSPQFIGWILSLGDKIKILSPEDVVIDFKKLVNSICALY